MRWLDPPRHQGLLISALMAALLPAFGIDPRFNRIHPLLYRCSYLGALYFASFLFSNDPGAQSST